MSFAEKYSKLYDALYSTKDYEGEVAYIDSLLRKFNVKKNGLILEIGTGTGKHASMLLQRGYRLIGLEPSFAMAREAITRGVDVRGFGAMDVDQVDEGPFDAVISLFHVVSYVAANSELRDLLQKVHSKVKVGGLFIFDVWHADAVDHLGMDIRVKRISGIDGGELVRVAEPKLLRESKIGQVDYELFVSDGKDGKFERFKESHRLRYLSEMEVQLACAASEFSVLSVHEFLTGLPASKNTWGVTYVLRAL